MSRVGIRYPLLFISRQIIQKKNRIAEHLLLPYGVDTFVPEPPPSLSRRALRLWRSGACLRFAYAVLGKLRAPRILLEILCNKPPSDIPSPGPSTAPSHLADHPPDGNYRHRAPNKLSRPNKRDLNRIRASSISARTRSRSVAVRCRARAARLGIPEIEWRGCWTHTASARSLHIPSSRLSGIKDREHGGSRLFSLPTVLLEEATRV